jgi:hypothetical protein
LRRNCPGSRAQQSQKTTEKSKNESSGPLRGEMPEMVAASGSTASCVDSCQNGPFLAATDTQIAPDNSNVGFRPVNGFSAMDMLPLNRGRQARYILIPVP